MDPDSDRFPSLFATGSIPLCEVETQDFVSLRLSIVVKWVTFVGLGGQWLD